MVEIIRGMTEAEYNARPEVRNSTLQKFRLPTPAHALHAMKADGEDKDCFMNGICLHALVLERKTVFDIDTGRKTQKNPPQTGEGPYILSPHNAAKVQGMAAGIKRNPEAMTLLESLLEVEIAIFWDGWKVRLDGFTPLGLLDIKSTSKGADAWNFAKSIAEFGYHISAAMYMEGAAQAGFPCEDWRWIVVESFDPYESKVWRCEHETLMQGRRDLTKLRAKYLECKSTGVWPGYPMGDEGINLPKWAFEKEENE